FPISPAMWRVHPSSPIQEDEIIEDVEGEDVEMVDDQDDDIIEDLEGEDVEMVDDVRNIPAPQGRRTESPQPHR
ncbi:hypothetical protein OC844_007104, partial [Tilletia horrida]